MSAVWESLKRVFSGKVLWGTGLALATLEIVLSVVCMAYVVAQNPAARVGARGSTAPAPRPGRERGKSSHRSFWYGANYGSNVNSFKLNGFPTACTSYARARAPRPRPAPAHPHAPAHTRTRERCTWGGGTHRTCPGPRFVFVRCGARLRPGLRRVRRWPF